MKSSNRSKQMSQLSPRLHLNQNWLFHLPYRPKSLQLQPSQELWKQQEIFNQTKKSP